MRSLDGPVICDIAGCGLPMTCAPRVDRKHQIYYRCRNTRVHGDRREVATKYTMFYNRKSRVAVTIRVLFRLMNKDSLINIYQDLSLNKNAVAQVYQDMVVMMHDDLNESFSEKLGKR